MKLLLYCTKAKPYLNDYRKREGCNQFVIMNKPYNSLNDTIIAECDFEVEEIKHYIHYEPEVNIGVGVLPEFECSAYMTNSLNHFQLLEKSCLEDYSLPNITVANELDDYLKGKNGYAIHIKNLHIFDKPELLFNFTTKKPKTYDTMACDSCTHFVSLNNCKKCSEYYDYQQVIKAPQNMMKVCEWNVNDKVLISIHSEQLCKILNGEKTIIIKKKVLKEMLKNER